MLGPLDLRPILGDRAPPFRILYIGARYLPEAPLPYAPLLAGAESAIVGFEPDAGECARLNGMFGPPHQFFPYAIGDGRPATFYHCRHPMTSSVLMPNRSVMAP